MRLLHRAAKARCLAPSRLSLDDLASPRRELPAPALLLGLCERGHRQEWSVEGRLARSVAPLPLPPLGKPWLRPRPRSCGKSTTPLRPGAMGDGVCLQVTWPINPAKRRRHNEPISYLRSYAGVRGETDDFPTISRRLSPRVQAWRHRPRGRRVDRQVAGQEGRRHVARRQGQGPRRADQGRRQDPHPHPRRPGGAGADPPRRGACDGRGRAGALPRHASDHRPGDRERLLLRLRPRRALHAGRPAGHRGQDARDHRARFPLHLRSHRSRTPRSGCSPTRAKCSSSS